MVLTYFTPSPCFLSFFKFSYLAKVNIAQNQKTHTHTLSPDTKTMVDTLLLLVPLKHPTSITSWPNDGGGVQDVSSNEDGEDVSSNEDGDDYDDNADDDNEDGSGGDVGGVDGVGVEATMTTTTIMKTTMTAATQQSNGARIGEGTTMATAMSTMFATTTVVVTKVAALTVKGSSIDSERRQR